MCLCVSVYDKNISRSVFTCLLCKLRCTETCPFSFPSPFYCIYRKSGVWLFNQAVFCIRSLDKIPYIQCMFITFICQSIDSFKGILEMAICSFLSGEKKRQKINDVDLDQGGLPWGRPMGADPRRPSERLRMEPVTLLVSVSLLIKDQSG